MNFIISAGFDGNHDYLARQTTYAVDYAVACGGLLEGHIDPSKIAAAGHSLGGKIAFYAAAIDPRISVVMAMDPSNGGGPPCFVSEEWCNAYPVAPNVHTGAIGMLDEVAAASFIMRAAPDTFNPDPQSNAEHFFYGLDGQGLHGVRPPALYFDMGPSGHASWLFLGKNLNVPRISGRTMVAWLKSHFHGASLDAYFTGEIVQEDIDAGYIVSVETR
jgi:pimeloyl-ACP methyl ester carboxylesterase